MIKEFLSKYERKVLIRAGVALFIYFLWVIWLGNYWFLLGLPIVFDMYLTRKVNWSPWKKREGDNPTVIEWLDALIFAVIAVTIINIFLFQNYKIPTGSMEKSLQINDHLYVSKLAYGPRIPNTPLALPFMSNTIPKTKTPSFVSWPHWNYKRLKGFGHVKRWDPVVFNFPEGDTVCFERSETSYYMLVRQEAAELKARDIAMGKAIKSKDEYYNLGRKIILDNYTMVVRPVDKTDNYIKRCVAVAGDSLEIRDAVVYINGEKEPFIPGRQVYYSLNNGGKVIRQKIFEDLGIYESNRTRTNTGYLLPLTHEMVEELSKIPSVTSIDPTPFFNTPDTSSIFPHSGLYQWTLDNFGPLYIPKKGATVEINMETLPFYERIIGHYEKNELEVRDSTIFINGEKADTYTFKMNYYWMMGDNRHSSLDSRYWGFVPEDHVIGTPKFIWLALNQDKPFPSNIQWKRMFRSIK